MIKLYYAPKSRASRPRWTLEELAVAYELEYLDMYRGDQRSPEYRRVHPLGQVPALVDDGQTMVESGAICVYLAEKYAERGLGAGHQPMSFYQWCFYLFGTLEPAIFDTLLHTKWLPEAQRCESVAQRGKVAWDKSLGHLEDHMSDGRAHLLGDRFTVADILVGGTLAWSNEEVPLGDYPHLLGYIERLKSRPAYQRAHAN